MAVPDVTPVTAPVVDDTVATPGIPDDHVPPGVTSESGIDEPEQTEERPDIDDMLVPV
jgi:hypothetical protein